MPAAAVIPAPIAYVIVAVVEKLVVGFRLQTRTFFTKRTFSCDFSIRVNVGWITRLQNTKQATAGGAHLYLSKTMDYSESNWKNGLLLCLL